MRLARAIGRRPGVVSAVALGRSCLERVIEMEFVERAIALASLAFTALVPVGVVASATVPAVDRDSFADSIVRRFDLDAQSAEVVRSAFSAPETVRETVSLLGILLVIGSALSFTRALQRVYEHAWHLPSLGIRATPAGLAWLGVLILFGSVFSGIRAALMADSRPIFSAIVALSFAAAIWFLSPWILLSRRVHWRALVWTAVITAVAMTALTAASTIYMPEAIATSAQSYGTIGVAIALVSWLVAAGFVLVVSAAVGAVLGERGAAPASPPPG